jgi:tetratricopeptide (TPR) repeat protein
MNAHRERSPRLAALLAAALLAALPCAAPGQDKKAAEDTETLKKQVADLKKQVAALQAQVLDLRRKAEELAAAAARERERATAAAVAEARARREAEKQRQLAEQHFQQAMKMLDQLLVPLPKERVLPDDKAARELLEKALKFYRQFQQGKEKGDKDGKDGKELQEKARDLQAAGVKAMQGGQLKEAEAAFRQSLALQQKLAQEFPAMPAYRLDLARGYLNLSQLHRVTGRINEAEASARQAIALLEQLLAPNVPDRRTELARAYRQLGAILRDLGRQGEAEETLRRADALEKK